MEWYNIKEKLPVDITKEEDAKAGRDFGDYDCILYSCLGTFVDEDEFPSGKKIIDKEVVALYYSGRDGWMYYPTMEPHKDTSRLTHWSYFPDPA